MGVGNAWFFFKAATSLPSNILITVQQQSVQLSDTLCPELNQAPCISHCLDFSNDKLSPQIRFEGYYCIS